jgi:hypothetical protein
MLSPDASIYLSMICGFLQILWGRELTVGCPVVVSPLPREWSCLYRRGQLRLSFLIS